MAPLFPGGCELLPVGTGSRAAHEVNSSPVARLFLSKPENQATPSRTGPGAQGANLNLVSSYYSHP